MANPWHHAVSSAKKHGGDPLDYLPIHQWFDASKAHHADFRHRALRHHAEGIFLMETIFGPTIALSTCAKCGLVETSILHDPENPHLDGDGQPAHSFKAKLIPTRWIGEQHVTEDLGRIPAATEWLAAIQPAPWMNKSRKLSVELGRAEAAHA